MSCINIDNLLFNIYCKWGLITGGLLGSFQAWDASHFAAWSSRLHQHSMFRRRQLSEGMALPHMQHGQEQIDINHITPVSSWITGSKESIEEMKKGIKNDSTSQLHTYM